MTDILYIIARTWRSSLTINFTDDAMVSVMMAKQGSGVKGMRLFLE